LWSQPQQGHVCRQLQSALTKEVELVKHGELVVVAELVELRQNDRRRESHRAVFQRQLGLGIWVTAWPTPTCRMSNIQLAVHAAWHMHGGEGGAPSANDRPEAPKGRSG
jgi:hypothetical protein